MTASQQIFRIFFYGQPPRYWDDWFDTRCILAFNGGTYCFTGQVQDLAEFVGILARLQMLNLEVLYLQYGLEPGDPGQDSP